MTTQTWIQEINLHLDKLIPKESSKLYEGARYSLFAGGKRIRPLLVLAVCDAYSTDISLALTPACAIEMVHTYSLIHDDLPCMDDDTLRRGKPTLHCVVSEATALLCGNYLLTHAFELLSQTPFPELLPCLAHAAGAEGMLGGQLIDLESEGKTISLETLKEMHLKKTAALICASLDFGAIIANIPPSERHLLKLVGQKIGLCFQIIDDLLDLVGDEEALGKNTGSDLENEKSTYPSLIGEEEAQRWAHRLHNEALDILKQLSGNPHHLIQLMDLIVNRTY